MPECTYMLVYMSVATLLPTGASLTQLLAKSREFNAGNGITGLLLYASGHFMQLFEGDQKIIEELMIRIMRDTRHREVEVLEKGIAARRQFPDWSMAFVDFALPEVRSLPGYSSFLEAPFGSEASLDHAARSVELLNYFKAVMTASNASLLNLTEAAGQRGEKSTGSSPIIAP